MEVVRYKEKYLVSDKGDVFKENKKYTIKKKQATNKYGYKVTKINGKQERVHRIVMEAFHGKSDLTVDHIDGNKENNNLNNLEYVTQTENAKRFHDKKYYGMERNLEASTIYLDTLELPIQQLGKIIVKVIN